MKCPKCQFENREKATFCLQCGGKLEQNCPQCGNILPVQASFCDECGYRLEERKEPPVVDFAKPHSYTPKHLADKILTSRSALEGERKLVTVLFADVANFTSLSEKLDPEEVHQILDGCFQILMDQIHRYEGTINQFTGDGVMALFGAPLAHEDHAQRACHAALSIQKAMEGYGEKIQRECHLPFRLRIGLNSGPVVVGKIGDDLRMDYTAIGDTTNLASRIQSLAQPGTILASSHTHHLVQAFFQFQPLGRLEVKGKEEPQQTYQLLKPTEVATRIAAATVRGLTRFVGREKEMQTLLDAYAKVQSGSGQIVGIVGEAGVGKSRLLLEFRQALGRDPLYLEGRCLHYGGSMVYLPFLDILRSYFDLKDGDSEPLIKKKLSGKVVGLDAGLQHILPPLQDLLSLKVEDQAYLLLEPRQKKERTFEALRDLFLRESQSRPLLLVLEDLHWIDKTSEEFLAYLLDWMPKSPILLLLLYRPEYTHPWGSKSYYSKIGLDQLPLQSSAELVQALLAEGEVASDLRQLILDRAAGNPLFMEELTHSLLESGSIRKQDHQYVLSRSPSEIPVPDTIQGVISARMDRLEEAMKQILQVASVIGRDFAFRILLAISGMQEELKSHLRNLQGLEFIYEKRLFPELEYIFKHALIQEVAYNSLLLKRRREIHEKIGLAIEQIYAERIEEFYEMLAYHFERAGVADKGVKYLQLAGERAIRLSAYEEAIGHFNQGLELLQSLPESSARDEQELSLQLDLFGPLGASRGYGSVEVLHASTRAVELCQEGVETTRTFIAIAQLRGYYNCRGEHKTELELAEQLLRLSQRSQDSDQILGALISLGSCLVCMGEFSRARVLLDQAIATYDPKKHRSSAFLWGIDSRIQALGFQSRNLWCLGYADLALKRGEEAIAWARELNHPFSLAQAVGMAGTLHSERREPDSTRRFAEEFLQISTESGLVYTQGWANIIFGWARAHQGELEDGIAQVREGLKGWQSVGMTLCVPYTLYHLAELYGKAGQVEEGLSLIEEAIAMVGKTEERWHEAEVHRVKGDLLISMERGPEAEMCFRKAIDVARRQEAKSWELRATLSLSRLLQKEGRSDEAHRLLSEIYGWFTEGFDTPDLKEAKDLLEEFQKEGGKEGRGVLG